MTSWESVPRRAPVQDWIAKLEDVGYVVVPSVLDSGDVEALRAAFAPASPGSTLHVEDRRRDPRAAVWRGLGGRRTQRIWMTS